MGAVCVLRVLPRVWLLCVCRCELGCVIFGTGCFGLCENRKMGSKVLMGSTCILETNKRIVEVYVFPVIFLSL